jgi:hypothetical protein
MTRRTNRYQSILDCLDSRFRKEYRYGLIISPFSTDEKKQARSRTYRPFYITDSIDGTDCFFQEDLIENADVSVSCTAFIGW